MNYIKMLLVKYLSTFSILTKDLLMERCGILGKMYYRYERSSPTAHSSIHTSLTHDDVKTSNRKDVFTAEYHYLVGFTCILFRDEDIKGMQ